MRVNDLGVFIIGEPGIGKSSLAIELLSQQHQLIADDSVDFKINERGVVEGCCPEMNADLLHSRELGLVVVTSAFGPQAWLPSVDLDCVVRLQPPQITDSRLEIAHQSYMVCGTSIPLLALDVSNSASVYHRLLLWLHLQSMPNDPVKILLQRQKNKMAL